jgi:hypothetical protein
MHARSGAFITAWNPFSKALGVKANEYWDRELKRHLSVRGFAFVEGEGRGRTGEWPPEPSVLAFGMSRAEASDWSKVSAKRCRLRVTEAASRIGYAAMGEVVAFSPCDAPHPNVYPDPLRARSD